MCACMPVCFQRNLVTFAKARPAQMISSPLVILLWLHALLGENFSTLILCPMLKISLG